MEKPLAEEKPLENIYLLKKMQFNIYEHFFEGWNNIDYYVLVKQNTYANHFL